MRLIFAFIAAVFLMLALAASWIAAVAGIDLEHPWSSPDVVKAAVIAGCFAAASVVSIASAIWWSRIDEWLYARRTRSHR